MIDEAVKELYSEFPYNCSVDYSGKFKPYRANVRLKGDKIEFNLSRKWETVSKEIQIGLMQELLLKLLRKRLKPLKKNTQNIELYNLFIKKVHLATPKTKVDWVLEDSFDRVNAKYFFNLLEKTNLVWGFASVSKLGSYEYGSDTITISSALEDSEQEMLDYVMYHEMLHKKHKFEKRGSRSYHHTSEFREREREFENSTLMERKLRNLLIKRRFSFRKMFNEIF